jgi:hypothetical protein
MIRYIVTFPSRVSDQAMFVIRKQMQAAENDQGWRDVILQEGAVVTRLNDRLRPSVATRNARKRLR